MTRIRVAAALAALVTALLLQGTLVGPLTMLVPVSLPAILVAAVALVDGPGAGLAFGFAAGLIADLGSQHPAGVLALCWLGVGVLCGRCASSGASVWRDASLAALSCGVAGLAAAAVLAVVANGTAPELPNVAVATLLDWLLAFAVVPLARAFLHSSALRAALPVVVLGADG